MFNNFLKQGNGAPGYGPNRPNMQASNMQGGPQGGPQMGPQGGSQGRPQGGPQGGLGSR